MNFLSRALHPPEEPAQPPMRNSGHHALAGKTFEKCAKSPPLGEAQ